MFIGWNLLPCGIDPSPRHIRVIRIEIQSIKVMIPKAPFGIVGRIAVAAIRRAVAVRRELYPIGVAIKTLVRTTETTVWLPIIIIIAMDDLP